MIHDHFIPCLLLAVIILAAGCNSDPYCQTAIANLRAERIQLENQYYSLKSQYEADMRRLGQPTPSLPAPLGSPPARVPSSELESIQPEIVEPAFPESTSRPTLDPYPAAGNSMLPMQTDVVGQSLRNGAQRSLASYVVGIETLQRPPRSGELGRLVIRPLDERGDIIPVEGTLTLDIADPQTGRVLARRGLDPKETLAVLSDGSNGEPGIHVGIPEGIADSQGLNATCRIEFRTTDGRLFHDALTLSASPETASGASRSVMQNASLGTPGQGRVSGSELEFPEFSDSPPLDDVTIVIGDETPPEQAGQSSGPAWSPERD